MTSETEEKRYPRPKNFEPESHFPAGHAWEGQKRCLGWRSKHARQCGNKPAKGRDHCRFCGGHAPRGIVHPAYVNGRYSKSLLASTRALYEMTLADKDFLALYDEIALLRTQVKLLLEGLPTEAEIKDMRLWTNAMQDAITNNDPTGLSLALTRMIATVTKAEDAQARLTAANEKIREIVFAVNSQVNNEIKTAEMMSMGTLLSLLTRVVDMMRDTVESELTEDQAMRILATMTSKVDMILEGEL